MKISKLFAFSLICCLFASCSDDSLVINKTSETTCQGKKCTNNQQNPGKQDPEKQDPQKDPPEDQTKPEQPPEDTLCNGADLMTDSQNCGTCGFSCEQGTCHEGLCVCNDNWLDCNGDGSCETEGKCECTAGEIKPCYEGDEGTAGIGACKQGYYPCIIDQSGAYWDIGNCIGQVLPAQDSGGYICDMSDPNRDNDCNGIPDSVQDEDADGYPICKDGKLLDCCDNEKMCNTTRPDLIHPAVPLDCKGNEIDDNCNGITDEDDLGCDEVVSTCEGSNCETEVCQFDYGDCDVNLTWNHSNNNNAALLLAKSMDLCMGSSSDPVKGSLLEYSLHRAGSTSLVGNGQINILRGMRDQSGNTLIKPRIGQSFVLLSSGDAIDALNGPPNGDQSFSDGGTVPYTYLKEHNNQLESHPMCKGGDPKINDSVVLHFKLQAPQNAKGFSFDFRFFSFEYPRWICTTFNDFFLTQLTDENGAPLVNADGNISFDEKGSAVSVNNAFFTTCVARTCGGTYGACPASFEEGCQGGKCGTCNSPEELYAFTPTPYNGASGRGGATAWLSTQAPIKGGQIFNLDFYIWDTGDHAYDSTVILDNFQWLCDATLNTGFAPPIDNPIN